MIRDPIVPIWVLTIPAFIALALVFLAHVARRGWIEAAIVAIAGGLYWSARENLQIRQLLLPHDYQTSSAALLKVGAAPFFVILGWTFTAFLAWRLAERISQRSQHWPVRSNPFIVLILSVFVVESISYLTETAGTIAGWWEWGRDGKSWTEIESLYKEWSTPLLVRIPSQPIGGWRMYELFFLGPLIISTGFLRREGRLTIRRAAIVAAICIVAYVVQFGLLAGPRYLTQGEFVITSGEWYIYFGFTVLILSFVRWRVAPPDEASLSKTGAFWEWIDRRAVGIAVTIYLFICLAVIVGHGGPIDLIAAVPFLLLSGLALTRLPLWLLLAAAAEFLLMGLLFRHWATVWAQFYFAEAVIMLGLWRLWQRRVPRLRLGRGEAG